ENSLVGEGGGELHHPAQVLLGKAAAVLLHQLRRQVRQDFLAIGAPAPVQDLRTDSLADAPVKHRQLAIHRRGGALARRLDQCPDVAQQRRRCCWRRNGCLAPVHAMASWGCRAPVMAWRRLATSSAASRTGLSSVWT